MWKNRCESFTIKGKRCKKIKCDGHFCIIHKVQELINIIEPIELTKSIEPVQLSFKIIYCLQMVITILINCIFFGIVIMNIMMLIDLN